MLQKLKNKYAALMAALAMLFVFGTNTVLAQGAIPTAIADAIDSVELVGAAVFAALVVIALPFLAWKLVKRIRG